RPVPVWCGPQAVRGGGARRSEAEIVRRPQPRRWSFFLAFIKEPIERQAESQLLLDGPQRGDEAQGLWRRQPSSDLVDQLLIDALDIDRKLLGQRQARPFARSEDVGGRPVRDAVDLLLVETGGHRCGRTGVQSLIVTEDRRQPEAAQLEKDR